MSVPRGTTPTFILTFTGAIDLTEAENVYVSFQSGQKLITKTGTDLDVQAKQISVYLSQQETLAFPVGDVKIQANWTTASGQRIASDVKTYAITEQLLQKVID